MRPSDQLPLTGPGISPVANRTYVGPTFAQVQVGPKRRAFLVRQGDRERLRDALLAASTIWGGARCPILTVNENGVIPPFWLQIADLLQVCEFVDFTRQPGGESAWQGASTGRWPITPTRPLKDGRYWSAHPLVAHDPAAYVTFYLPAEQSLRSLAAVGHIALEEERKMWRHEGVTVLERTHESWLLRAQLRGTTVLDATIRHDVESSIGSPVLTSIGLLWIVDDPEDFDEIVAFWNYRALRPRDFRTGLSVLTCRESLTDPESQSELLELLRETAYTKPDVTIAGRLTDTELANLASSLGLKLYLGDVSEQLFAEKTDPNRTLTYRPFLDPTPGWVGERSIGPQHEVSLALQRPASQLRARSPLPWHPKMHGHGQVVFRFSAPELVAPPRPQVAQLFHPQATFQNGFLQIATNPLDEYIFPINLPSEAEILAAACAGNSVAFVLNDKGQQVRGVATVGIDLKIFRDADAIAVIQALTPEPDRDLLKRLEQLEAEGTISPEQVVEMTRISAAKRFWDRTLSDIRSDDRCRRQNMVATRVANVLEGLVANRLVLRGWRVDCEMCSLQVFVEVHEVRPRAVCSGCNSHASYATSDNGEPRVFYRLNTLLQRISHNGGLAVLAATSTLVDEGSYVVPGVNVTIRGKPNGDLDLLGWRERQLFAGEVKMSAGGFALHDVDRDVAKSAEIGADVHIAACLEPIPTDVRQRMARTCEDAGIQFRCLDGKVLLPNRVILN